MGVHPGPASFNQAGRNGDNMAIPGRYFRPPESSVFLSQNQYSREKTFMDLQALKQIDRLSVLLECK
jgi:hypothetical protein